MLCHSTGCRKEPAATAGHAAEMCGPASVPADDELASKAARGEGSAAPGEEVDSITRVSCCCCCCYCLGVAAALLLLLFLLLLLLFLQLLPGCPLACVSR